MVTYKKARPGMKWQLTARGFELGRIRAKFEIGNRQRASYEKQVPTSWADKGYVQEVATKE